MFALVVLSWPIAGCFALFGLDGYGPPREGPDDDAGSSPADGPTEDDAPPDDDIEPLAGKVVFVTSTRFSGAIGGLAAADARCQSLATSAGLSGVFKAWLSDGDESPSTRFSSARDADGGPLVTPDRRQVIAPSIVALTSGLDVPIAMTELGTTLAPGTFTPASEDQPCVVSGSMVWTNTTPQGTRTSLTDCDAWSTNASTSTGPVGVVLRADAGPSDDWTAACSQPCSATAHLYCFEQ